MIDDRQAAALVEPQRGKPPRTKPAASVRRPLVLALLVLCLALTASLAHAHEFRPAVLSLRQLEPGRYALAW